MSNERKKAQDARMIAEQKLNEMNQRRQDESDDRRKRIHDMLSANDIKNDDVKRQERFEELEKQKNKIPESKFRLPENVRPEQFEHELVTYGWAFCTQKYNVSRNDIRSEASRLGLKIDFDMVRR